MRLLSKFSNHSRMANFAPNPVGAIVNGVKQVAHVAKEGAPGVVDKAKGIVGGTVKAITGVGLPADEQAMRALVEDAKAHRAGFWGKAGAAGGLLMGLGSVPMMAGMVVPDATTRAVQAMRNEDKLREAKGLMPLSETPALLNEKVNEAKQAAGMFSYSDNDTRVVNMAPKYILPGDLPANSLR